MHDMVRCFQVPPVVSLCLYRDVSGLFTNKIPDEFTNVPEQAPEPEVRNDVDNEDDLLYGDDIAFEMPTLSTNVKPKSSKMWWRRYMVEVKPTYWLFLVRDNSNLEIYSVPEFRLSYIVRNLALGHKVLIDSLESVPMFLSNMNLPAGDNLSQRAYEIKEILMVSLGNHGSRPLLLVRMENDLYIYQVFRFSRGNLKMRFKKLSHNIMYKPSQSSNIETENSDFYALQDRVPYMRYFSNIAGKHSCA